MKIERIDKRVADMIAKEATAALQALAAKYGMTVADQGGKFTPDTMMCRIEFMLPLRKEANETNEFLQFASMYGAKPEWFGQSFTDHGISLKVTGLNHRKPKYRIKLQGSNGKPYNAPVEFVKRFLG